MPIFMATKLGIQFARFAAASGNAGTSSLRGAFTNATSGSTSSATSSWTQGLSSGGASSANGAGLGGAKFHAGRGAHSTFQQSGRALANANASSSHDGSNSIGDDEEDLTSNQARIHRPGQLHRSALNGRQFSKSHSRLVRVKGETHKTSLSALQLILPRAEHTSRSSSASPAHVRTLTSVATTSSAEPIEPGTAPLEGGRNADQGKVKGKDNTTIPRRRHGRSNSMGPTIGRRVGVPGAEEKVEIESIFANASHSTVQQSTKVLERNDEVEESLNISKEVRDIINAVNQQKDANTIRSFVTIYRNADRSSQSVFGFNKAIEALMSIKRVDADMDEITSIYLQMIETNFRPSTRTWELLTCTLCHRDMFESSRGIESDEKFNQALSLFKLAHPTKGAGFTYVLPYNLLLRSCQIRGDTKKACDVLEKLSQNRRVQPNAGTFDHLLNCFSNDNKLLEGESEKERNERVLKSTQKIFDEFEKKREEDGRPQTAHQLAVWNSMMDIYLKFDDKASAIALVERMITDPSTPRADRMTSAVFIGNLFEKGEFEDAVSWLERIIGLDSNNGEVSDATQQFSLPLPSEARMMSYPSKIRDQLMLIKDQGKYDADPSTLFELASLAQRIAGALLNAVEGSTLTERKRRELFVTLRCALQCNDILFDKCFSKDETSLSASTDKCLELIHRFSEVVSPSLIDESSENVIEQIRRSQILSRSILYNVSNLVRLKRFQDAASAFTYAMHFSLLSSKQGINDAALSEKLLSLLNIIATLLVGGRVLGTSEFNIEPLSADELRQYGGQILIANAEMVLPALESLEGKWDWQRIYPQVIDLYAIVRQEIEANELPLSAVGWNAVINAFVSIEESEQASLSRGKGSFELLKDVASLPKDLLDDLNLVGLARVTLQNNRTEAEDVLNTINPDLVSAEQEASASSEYTESTLNTSTNSGDGISETTTAMPMTFENILEGFTSPPANIDKLTAQYPWPPIQLIDEDLGSQLDLQCTGQRGKGRFGGTQAADPEGAYKRLMTSINEFGTYPSIQAIATLLVSAGRVGNLERVNQLYVIGCHIVAALGGDLELQAWSWATLESEMISAMAHAGEAKVASDHRHRLINAGHVPSAHAYAALIAVVRDTTDDATIAEELYQESQRLGVVPNVYLFNTVISKLCRARKVERAMQLFNDMRQRGLHPSSVTYGALINGCTRIGDEANAKEFFALMESDRGFKPQAPPFNTMIQFYTHSHPDRAKAMRYFDKLLEKKVEPSSHTYKLLLDLHGTVEPVDINGMEHFFGRLIADRKISVQGTHWASIITAHGIHCHNIDKAIEIFESIPEHVATKKSGSALPDVIAYEALLNVFLTHERIDLMESYIAKMRQSGIQPTAYIANLMIKGLASQIQSSQSDLDGLAKARALFAEMHDPPMGVAAVGNHPPNHRHHAKHPTSVSQVQHSSNDGTYGFNGILREPSTFEAMIKVELQYGHHDEANGLVERMRERGYPPALITKAYGLLAGEASPVV